MTTTVLRTVQALDGGDLVMTFTLDLSFHDRELLESFGEQRINVGGAYFTPATVHPTIANGVITAVTVDTQGANYTYTGADAAPIFVINDPSGAGINATFTPTISATGKLTAVVVATGGTSYDAATTITVRGGNTLTIPNQYIGLLTGFPFVRRVSNISIGTANASPLNEFATNYRTSLKDQIDSVLTIVRGYETAGLGVAGETADTI